MALEKAFLSKVSPASGARVPFLFNPSEYTVEKGNQFAEIGIPGLGSPLLQFVRGGSKTMKMDLFFDTYEQRKVDGKTYPAHSDVRELTDQVTDLMAIDAETHAPPVCLFTWGKPEEKGKAFTGVIESVSKKFTMFLSDGTPVRATLSVAFKEYVSDDLRSHPQHSTDHAKQYAVERGDTLCSIAAREYGDPAEWRRIADENRIDNPRELQPGQVLLLPATK